MLKKGFSMLAAAILVLPLFRVSVSAAPDAGLPFTLTAPEHVAITYLNGTDSLNTCHIVWSQNDSMCKWASRVSDPATHEETENELAALGYDSLSYTAQIDWSIDSTEDWHYNAYWDTDGYDSNYVQHLGEWAYTDFMPSDGIFNEGLVFSDLGSLDDPGDAAWNGRHEDGDDYTGWKDVLKEGQYSIVDTVDGGRQVKLDFDNHTVNVRMRWLVTAHKAGEPADGNSGEIRIGSDWSQIVSVGKDAPPAVSVKAGDIAAPVIRDLQYPDEDAGMYSVLWFQLDVPDSLTNTMINLAAGDGTISLYTEGRVAGGEWVELQDAWPQSTGVNKVYLQDLAREQAVPKDTTIELRCRYGYSLNPETEMLYSDYSNVLSILTDQVIEPKYAAQTPGQEGASTTVWTGTNTPDGTSSCLLPRDADGNPEKSSDIGWVWIILVVLAAIVLILIIVMTLNKRKEDGGDKR